MKNYISKISFLIIFTLIICQSIIYAKSFYIRIEASVEPGAVRINEEGILKIRVTPSDKVKISSAPEFVIRLDDNEYIRFNKNFFTASELDFKTKQVGNNIYLNLDKEIKIPFKNESNVLQTIKISGRIIYTAVEQKDNWSVKTFKRFSTYFKSKKAKKQ